MTATTLAPVECVYLENVKVPEKKVVKKPEVFNK